MTGKNKKNNFPYIKNIRLNKKQLNVWNSKEIKAFLDGTLPKFSLEEIKNIIFNEMTVNNINTLPLSTQNSYFETMGIIQTFLKKQLDNLKTTHQGSTYNMKGLYEAFGRNKYYCTKCKKEHKNDSIIGLKHTNFKKEKIPLHKLKEIEEMYFNKEIRPNDAIIQIIGLCNYVVEEDTYTPINEKNILEKAIDILLKINTKSLKVYEFIESMVFDSKINREYILPKLKELYPKKSIKLIQHFEKNQ